MGHWWTNNYALGNKEGGQDMSVEKQDDTGEAGGENNSISRNKNPHTM